ncbi:serpin family protein [Chloroflexota bacterium]
MTKVLSIIMVICICMVSILTACTQSTVRALTKEEESLVQSDNAFGFKIFKEIIDQEQDENIFISPLSIAMALGMTLNGANGETREAMQKVLELSGLTEQEINESYESLIELLGGLDPKVIFQIANSIWYRQGIPFREEFFDLARTYFDAEISGLDFSDPDTLDVINGWVDENTSGKIKEIVDEIDPLTVMFLINAIYFKGTWTYEFDEGQTTDDLFTTADGSQKACRMMHLTGELQYFENSDFQVIDLPYGDGDYSMTVFLPRPGKDVDSLIAEFDENNWRQWLDSLDKNDVALYLPKFKLEYELDLNDVLTALGMGIAFEPGNADFTRMCDSGGLYIHKVKHKTFIEVNEEGTEAAAVTSVEMRLTSAPGNTTMRVDRPFMFVIRETRSQTLLFMGKIVEPGL